MLAGSSISGIICFWTVLFALSVVLARQWTAVPKHSATNSPVTGPLVIFLNLSVTYNLLEVKLHYFCFKKSCWTGEEGNLVEVLFKWFFCPGLSSCCLLVVPQPPPGGSCVRTSEQLEGSFIWFPDLRMERGRPTTHVLVCVSLTNLTLPHRGPGNTYYWMCIRMLLTFIVSELETAIHWTSDRCSVKILSFFEL